jgi:(p)ppGpp synthase/HD superfamily hydrolase
MGHLSFTEAEELARTAHAGQVGADGSPFVEHPLRVARAVAEAIQDETAMVVAVLHDAIEKGVLTWEHLAGLDAGDEVLSAVDALTQRPDEVVADYLDRCRANPIARQVKRFDLLDKLRPDQLDQLSLADRERMRNSTQQKLIQLDGGAPDVVYSTSIQLRVTWV